MTFLVSCTILAPPACPRPQIPVGRPMPRPILLQRPMSCGVVNDWDDIEEIWRYGIEEMMGLDAVEHPVLMADSTATPPGARYASVSLRAQSFMVVVGE